MSHFRKLLVFWFIYIGLRDSHGTNAEASDTWSLVKTQQVFLPSNMHTLFIMLLFTW